MLALQTEGLSKLYGSRLAVSELHLEVQRGEAFGLLGPNGAGKSTCLKMLLGLARPTSGGGQMLGRALGDVEVRRQVGFLPEHFHFQDWLSGAELLRLHGRLYGLPGDALRQRIPQLLARVGLEHQGDKPLRDYSKGMQQRVGLAQALLNEPKILFLDEPTSGLDPLGRRLVREVIAEQRARGVTVFLNSHLLGEVEVSCDRVGFVKDGRLLEVREVAASDGPLEVRVRLAGDAGPRTITHTVASESELPRLLRELVASGLKVAEFTPQRRSLEEVFLNIVGDQQ